MLYVFKYLETFPLIHKFNKSLLYKTETEPNFTEEHQLNNTTWTTDYCSLQNYLKYFSAYTTRGKYKCSVKLLIQ